MTVHGFIDAALGRLTTSRRGMAATTTAASVGVAVAVLLTGGAGAGAAQAAPPQNLPALPGGAVRTLLSSNAGGDAYKTVLTDGDVCLTTTATAGGTTATTCAQASEAAEYGVAQVQVVSDGQYAPAITVLPPTGVTSVTFEMTDGTATTVPVDNGVAQFAGPKLATAQFALPQAQGSAGSNDITSAYTAGTVPSESTLPSAVPGS